MVLEIESVALGLFEARGFAEVTVEEIAAQAGVSPRTFYRHFAIKEEVIQVRIDQSAKALRAALAERPFDEAPVRSLRRAFVEVVSVEDLQLRRRWMMLVMSSSALVRAALGGHELKLYPVMAEFFGVRLGVPAEDLVPVMLAAAAGGVLRTASTQWLFEGGSLAARIDKALEVLEVIVDARDVAGSD